MKTAFVAISSKEYINHYKVLFDSTKKHVGYVDQILYHIGNVQEPFDQKIDITHWYNEAIYPDTLTKICSLRPRVVLDAFNKGYDKVVFLGAKIEWFSDPYKLINLLDIHTAVVTPHITQPLPEDGRMPSNASVSFTGHISTDLVAFRNTFEIKEFLRWQDSVMSTQCKTTSQTYLDQSWLNFLPFFVEGVYIMRDLGYNVAYWNFNQRGMYLNSEGKWMMKDGNELIAFQYSGLVKGKEHIISSHQSRYEAVGDFLVFLKEYTNKL